MKGLVSVVMPAYNVGDYIEKSIQSVQAQTYTNWELIVVNDGSTDNTQDVVEKLAAKDSRIRLINQPNGGVSRARNKGLDLARGEYISFLDSDDQWKPTFLAELLQAKEQANAGMVYCGYERLYSNGLRRGYRYQYPSGRILCDALKGNVRILSGGFIVDKGLLDAHGIRFTEDCPIGEDQEVILKLLSLTKVQAVPKDLLIYVQRPDSAIRSKWDWKKHIHSIYALERTKKFVSQRLEGTQELESVLALFEHTLATKTLRFFWRMLKYEYYHEAQELMSQANFKSILETIEPTHLGLVNRIKYQIVMSQNCRLWRLAKLLR